MSDVQFHARQGPSEGHRALNRAKTAGGLGPVAEAEPSRSAAMAAPQSALAAAARQLTQPISLPTLTEAQTKARECAGAEPARHDCAVTTEIDKSIIGCRFFSLELCFP